MSVSRLGWRIRDAGASEARVLEALQRRAFAVWEAYREQLAANPDAIELPGSFIARGWVRVAVAVPVPVPVAAAAAVPVAVPVADDETPAGFSVVIPAGDAVQELDGLFVEPKHMYRGLVLIVVNPVVV